MVFLRSIFFMKFCMQVRTYTIWAYIYIVLLFFIIFASLRPSHYLISCILEVDRFDLGKFIWYIWSQEIAYFHLESFLFVHYQWIPDCNACKMAVSISTRKWSERNLKKNESMVLRPLCYHNILVFASNLFHFMQKIYRSVFGQNCWKIFY